MISDVLSDAAYRIREYMQEMPGCYGAPEPHKRIVAVLRAMDELREWLDNPFASDTPDPPLAIRYGNRNARNSKE